MGGRPSAPHAVSSLTLTDRRTGRVDTFADGPVLIGRAPECDVVVTGEGCEVVSGSHARLIQDEGGWLVLDAGGRNGTFVDGDPVPAGESLPIASGQTLSLGGPGVAFAVQIEDEARGVAITLTDAESGEEWEGSAPLIRVGRSDECEVCLLDAMLVSRVHCEIFPGTEGAVLLRDNGSRNGTLVDGRTVTEPAELHAGSSIRLGSEGPEFLVARARVTGAASVPVLPTAVVPAASAPARADDRPVEPVGAGSPGAPAPGRTAFFKALIHETEQRHVSRTRRMVGTFVLLLLLTGGGAFAFSEYRMRETEAELASQRTALNEARVRADSIRAAGLAEYGRLEQELAAARSGSAPAAVVDSLRDALSEASFRTAALEAALERAQAEMSQQLSVGDSLREAQEQETERLRALLASGQAGGVSPVELASLREAVAAAEARAGQLEAGLRAIRGADLASIAEAHQDATGLVSVFAGENIHDGSGFVVTASGYFVTNRHVAQPNGRTPDSVHITMADRRTGHRARVVAVSPQGGPDLAVLQIPDYTGPFITDVDWEGTGARQGEPAALIGFPAGVATALDDTRTVRTSMSAGIFSKVTETELQFDGFTIGGSSGSPIFNANGEVVAVHSSGLRGNTGLGFAVPIPLVLPLLPADARREVAD